ncbi:MAG: amylo-alpha-1,6-glucosidase [Bacteroidales bacterium]|nr:amylo-alpha-1,6-glucosidase [Bacteroidales bacterium]
MAFLKFNKSELVNRSYSLRREIICAGKSGSYANTSIVFCNTRRYHGLLAVTLDRFGGDKYLLLSSLDESLTVDGKQFNLGIHCYGDIYEPRGHKYVVDFEADPIPAVTYKVGAVVLRKSLIVNPSGDQTLIRYELLQAPSAVTVQLKPFLAFRNIHALTEANSEASFAAVEVEGGRKFRMYEPFPDLYLQFSDPKTEFEYNPHWNYGITYSDEYRRGFDCREDLFVPGTFQTQMKPGSSIVFSASTEPTNPTALKRLFTRLEKEAPQITGQHDQLVRWADTLISTHHERKRINAGLSWLLTGLLRETLLALPGIALYGKNSPSEFEEILDNLIADEQERLFRRTTQVEAPLYLASVLQSYLEYGADSARIWKKYGDTVKGVIESYLPGRRREVSMQPNGLLWAQMENVALSWMNAYVYGQPVTERPGYQVETNAFWYNSICFAVEMEKKHGRKNSPFTKEWEPLCSTIRNSFMETFWNPGRGCLADYVDGFGQNMDIRPNQLLAIWVRNSPVDEELFPSVLRVIDNELVTARGIRSLSPRDIKYKGVYEGSQVDRDLAYHQGCAFPFLLEQYIDVAFRIKGASFVKKAEWLCEGFYDDLSKHGVGAFAELYDGDPPQEPHGAIASAGSTAALLAADHFISKYKEAGK